MPGLPGCGHCPFADDPEVACHVVRSKHVRLCALVDPGSPAYKPTAREAVVRMTLAPLGLWPRMRGKYAAKVAPAAKPAKPVSPAARPAEFPPLVAQARNLAGAAARFVASGMVRASPEEQARRRAICQSNVCGMFQAGRCRKCGCRLAYKTAMASEHCPLNPPLW